MWIVLVQDLGPPTYFMDNGLLGYMMRWREVFKKDLFQGPSLLPEHNLPVDTLVGAINLVPNIYAL